MAGNTSGLDELLVSLSQEPDGPARAIARSLYRRLVAAGRPELAEPLRPYVVSGVEEQR